MPGTPSEPEAGTGEGSSSGDEEVGGDFLQVPVTQIGDIVFITRLQCVDNVPKSPLERRESFKSASTPAEGKPITRFTLTAEGIADDKVSGIVADEWLQNPHHCLFRIETPSTVLDTGEPDSAEMKLEARANKASFEKSQGDVLKYGQEVQLRHIHSDRLLSLNLLAAASAPGAWSVSVNAPSEFLCRQITLLPFNRSHNIGDTIKCGEAASIVFQTDNLKYYLQSEIIQENLLDINSTHKPASWKFLKFESYKETDADAIKFGETIIIKYSKLSMFMALEAPKPDPEAGRLPIVTKAEVKDYSNYWVLQNVDILEGGCVKWKSRFHIKNALTGHFLGPSLKLQDKPDSSFYFFFPKPDSFIEDSVIPNGYPLMIKSRWDLILSPDSRKTNEEALDHLVPFNEKEPTAESGEIGLVMQKLEHDQRETLFELDYVKPWDGAFFNLIIGLYPKFRDTKEMLEGFQREEKHSWEAVEALEKRLGMMLGALENITMSIREAAGDELESKQKIFTGLDFHSILIKIASVLQTLFQQDNAAESGATELLITHVQHNLAAIWDLLNDVVLESEVAAQKIAEHQAYLCELLRFDTRRIGALLTEVFRLVDPEIKDPKEFYHQWCARLMRLSKANLQEQVIYMRIIRNLCEIGDSGVLEYQKEITRNLFNSEIAIDLLVFSEISGEVAVHFGEMGAAVSAEEFKKLNPDLAPFLKEDSSGQAIVLLRELSGLENYVEYVQTALLLYHAVCRGRCVQAREHLERRSHIDVRMALLVSQDLKIHMDVRQACLFLLEALCISLPPYEAYSDNDTSFNYAEIKLQQMKEDISTRQLINYSARNANINKCLEILFRFWMNKELPAAIRPKTPAEPMEKPNLFSPMKYLMAMLRVTLAIVEYKHATELWSQCILKAVQYVLAGFTLSAHLYADSHWGATLVAQAVRAGEGERRVKIIVNEILSCVLNVLLAIKQVSRRHGLGQAITVFISEASTLRNPLLGTGLKHLNPLFEEKLSKVTSSDRGDRVLEEYFKLAGRAEKRGKKSILNPLLADSDSMGESGFKPGFDFKDLVSKAPLINDLFIRVILEWPSFSSQLKNKVIDVMNEIFQGNRLFVKALGASDVISLGPISQIFNRLRWLKDNMELSSLCVRAKFECGKTDKSPSLQQIIHLLQYLTDFCHPLNGSSDFVIKKTQNILRQLELHKDVSVVWQLIHSLEKTPQPLATHILRLKSAIISFYFYFAVRNQTNTKELARLLVPSMLSINVIQFASLLRLLNDFAHLHIRDVTRIFVYILDEIQAEETKDMNSMMIFEKMMFDRTGMLKKNVQNVASSLLSEKISDGLVVIKERPHYIASLLENLARAAEDNPPVITQCRHLLPLSDLQDMMFQETHPLLISAFVYFIYTVYVKKADASSQIKTLDRIEDVADILKYVLEHANHNLRNPQEILPLVIEGSYSLVYFKSSPAYTDININLHSSKPELNTWHSLCKEWDGRQTGIFRTVSDILEAVEPNTNLVPILSDFYYALVECRTKVERMEEQTRDLLCFTPLLNVLRETGTLVKKSLDKLQVELSEENLSVIQADAYPIPETLLEQLRLALKGVLPFNVDSQSKGHLEVDQQMNDTMKAGCEILPKVCPPESEDGYINVIVSLIDTRLSQGPNITNKKDIKDLIASLAKKVRGLQKLFTSSKQRTLFFKIVEGIVPKEENIKFKLALNPLFQELKLMDYAVTAVLRNEAHDEVMAALSFLIKLFLMQSQEFMEKFRMGINENSMAYPLFMKLQTEMINGKALILEQAQIAKTRKSSAATPILQQAIGTLMKPKKPVESTETVQQQKLLISMLNFIQICCDNCNEPFQIFYREQKNTEGKADVDLVNALAGFLIDIRSANTYLFNHDTTFETLNAALSAFVDFVTGPCVSNQIVLGNNVRIYLLMNQLIEECQGKLDPKLIEIHRNCIRFLTCLLEGHPDESVYETMSKFLRLDLLREGCERIYQNLIVGKEEEISLELSSLRKEHKDVVQVTLMQAILLMKMRMVGVMHDELTKFEQPLDDLEHCYGYFCKYIGYVEIDRNGVLEGHLFPIPWKCKYITASTRNALIVEVNRSSHQEKTEDFLNQIPNCKLEMTHQQLLWCSKAFKSFSLHWQLFGKIAYYIALVTNATLVYTITRPDFSDLKENIVAFTIVATLGVMQISTYMACFFFNLIEYYPQAVAKGNPPIKEFEMEEFSKVKDSDSQLMNAVHDTIMSGGEKDYKTQLQSKLKEVLFNFDLYYQYWYFLISIIAIYEPVFYPFVLLDMIKQTPELVNVLKAVTLNFRQLILTMWLGVIIVYLFSVGSFVFYATYYDQDSMQYCENLWNCFFTTLNVGIRSGGGHMGIPGEEDYWVRMVMDMFFYLILIVILLNIIFGIIIDAFAELRDQRTEVLDDVHNRCYICGQERSLIEQKGKGWSYHFMIEHSPFAYLSFLVYISDKKVYDCTGLEKHVKELYDSKDTDFMPKTSISMEGLEVEEEEEED